ncbi:hypothetical protein, partial [Microbacterium sp.]|uniref:hypothetical protein n=1 Tax=Microbacterium sp. TaxID=51671 RepID=UPI003F9D0855
MTSVNVEHDGVFLMDPLRDDDVFDLRREAVHAARASMPDSVEVYVGARPDGSFGTPLRCRYAQRGPVLERLHRDPDLLTQMREETGLNDLEPSRTSYMFYGSGDYLGIHRDSNACDYTLLIAITDKLDPLRAATSMIDAGNSEIAD